MTFPDFTLSATGPVTQLFQNHGITTFGRATLFISNLPYGRNSDKEDVSCLFYEQKGTCSTKHAALKQLADENVFYELKLMLGIFRMHAGNSSNPCAVRSALYSGGPYVPQIPEQHIGLYQKYFLTGF